MKNCIGLLSLALGQWYSIYFSKASRAKWISFSYMNWNWLSIEFLGCNFLSLKDCRWMALFTPWPLSGCKFRSFHLKKTFFYIEHYFGSVPVVPVSSSGTSIIHVLELATISVLSSPPLKINLYLFSFSFLESFLNFSFKSLLAFSSKVTFLSLLLMNFYFFPFYLNILISPSFLFTFIGLSAGFLIILVFRFTFYFLLLWVY